MVKSRPNLTGRKPRPVEPCQRCGEVRRICASGLCKPCWTKDHPVKKGECASCGRYGKLPRRGLCDRCARVLPRGSGVDCRKRAVIAKDAEVAARYHAEFVDQVVPRLEKHAWVRTAGYLTNDEREEFAASVVALGWEVYL